MDERIQEIDDIAARQRADALSNEIIGAAIEVHRYLGPGLFESAYEAQLLTYLRLRNSWLGMIINFNVKMLRNGIKRLVNG
jgi:hypothetical protein